MKLLKIKKFTQLHQPDVTRQDNAHLNLKFNQANKLTNINHYFILTTTVYFLFFFKQQLK